MQDISVGFFRDPLAAVTNGKWGGPISWSYTSAVAGVQIVGGWLACQGLFVLVLGIMNLLPVPLLNGFKFIMLLFEACGLKISESLHKKFMMIGLPMILGLMMMCVVLDIRWFF